jgi:hypothetical protein
VEGSARNIGTAVNVGARGIGPRLAGFLRRAWPGAGIPIQLAPGCLVMALVADANGEAALAARAGVQVLDPLATSASAATSAA